MNYSKPYRSLGGLLLAAVLLLSGGLAVAQEFRGTILGRITDPSGAAVPGVQITVTNEKTNVSSNAVSENDGVYQVPFLIPGAYRLEVGAAGFNKYLETSTGGMGHVIDKMKVESMPLNGRMVFMLNQLAEGVIWQIPTFGATGTSGLRPFDNLGGSAHWFHFGELREDPGAKERNLLSTQCADGAEALFLNKQMYW